MLICVPEVIHTILFTFRPARSTSFVDTNVPSSCMAPTIIADKFGDMSDPDSANIVAV